MGIESQMRALQMERCEKKNTNKLPKAPETTDPNRRFLKDMIKNYFQRDVSQIVYEVEPIYKVLEQTIACIRQEKGMLRIEAPMYVCGDIHGQITDLRRIFHICGFPSRKRFLFLGDYVDRGAHALEVVVILCCMKLLWPHNIWLLRGNHEIQHINKDYGFRDEIRSKLINPTDAEMLFRRFNEVFAWFPLAAVISEKILCMHGGLSPTLIDVDDIGHIPRPIISPKGFAQDILWADPMHGVVGFKKNSLRQCSYNFGEADVKKQLKELGVCKMIRAHQVVQHGWEAFADGSVITVFSACRYQDDLCNYGAVIDVQKNLGIGVIMIKPSDFDEVHSHYNEPPTVDNSKST